MAAFGSAGCTGCGAGTVPNEDNSSCVACADGMYAMALAAQLPGSCLKHRFDVRGLLVLFSRVCVILLPVAAATKVLSLFSWLCPGSRRFKEQMHEVYRPEICVIRRRDVPELLISIHGPQ